MSTIDKNLLVWSCNLATAMMMMVSATDPTLPLRVCGEPCMAVLGARSSTTWMAFQKAVIRHDHGNLTS